MGLSLGWVKQKTKDWKVGIGFFSAKHAAFRSNYDWLVMNQDHVFEWSDMWDSISTSHNFYIILNLFLSSIYMSLKYCSLNLKQLSINQPIYFTWRDELVAMETWLMISFWTKNVYTLTWERSLYQLMSERGRAWSDCSNELCNMFQDIRSNWYAELHFEYSNRYQHISILPNLAGSLHTDECYHKKSRR